MPGEITIAKQETRLGKSRKSDWGVHPAGVRLPPFSNHLAAKRFASVFASH